MTVDKLPQSFEGLSSLSFLFFSLTNSNFFHPICIRFQPSAHSALSVYSTINNSGPGSIRSNIFALMEQIMMDGTLSTGDFCTFYLQFRLLHSTKNDHHIKIENMTEYEMEIARTYLNMSTTFRLHLSPNNPYLKQVYEGIVAYRVEVLPEFLQMIEPRYRDNVSPNNYDWSYNELHFARRAYECKIEELPNDFESVSFWSAVLERNHQMIREEYQLSD